MPPYPGNHFVNDSLGAIRSSRTPVEARRTIHAAPMTPSPAYLCSVAILVPFSVLSTAIVNRGEVPPSRAAFVDFPMQIDGWHGAPFALEQHYIDALRFDDYVLADYRSDKEQPVNFYAAYYRSQRKGQSAHSPQSCLPGGGWEIASLTQAELSSVAAGDASVQGQSRRHSEGRSKANRLVLV